MNRLSLSHWNAIKQNAIKRNFNFDVTPEYLWNLYEEQNGKCALSGVAIGFTENNRPTAHRTETSASLDRINSKLGYINGNVRWVHKDINRMRWILDDQQFLNWCRKCLINSVSTLPRPSFDIYFLTLAFDIATRSEDSQTKHGAIIVDTRANHIIGTGYNALVRGIDKNKLNLDRVNKHKFMIHAEENAIMNCTLNPLTIQKAKIYITGKPCINCLQRLINFGIKNFCIAKRKGTTLETIETNVIYNNLIDEFKLSITELDLCSN